MVGPFRRLLNTLHLDSDLEGAQMRTILESGLAALEARTSKAVASLRSRFKDNNQVLGSYSPESPRRFLRAGLDGPGMGKGAPFAEATRRLEPS